MAAAMKTLLFILLATFNCKCNVADVIYITHKYIVYSSWKELLNKSKG